MLVIRGLKLYVKKQLLSMKSTCALNLGTGRKKCRLYFLLKKDQVVEINRRTDAGKEADSKVAEV